MKYNSFSEEMGKALIGSSEDAIIDSLDSCIDLITNGPVEKFPVVGIAVSLIKSAHKLDKIFMLKKTKKFILEIANKKQVKNDEYKNYIEKIRKKGKEAYKELDYVLTILDKMSDGNKSEYLADLYMAYIIEEIDLNTFIAYIEVLDRFLLIDKEYLIDLYNMNYNTSTLYDTTGSINRLMAFGIVYRNTGEVRLGEHISSFIPDKDYELTDFGKKFCEICFI